MRDVNSPAMAGRGRRPAGHARLARSLAAVLGGRYSCELGIDVDAGDGEVERWFLAATLFGTRIAAGVAERTFAVLNGAGLHRVTQAGDIPLDDLVALLDEGGYARYDFRMATRLRDLAQVISEHYSGQVAVLGRRFPSYAGLRRALDALPGWGPVTVQLFLRELRGVWPGAQPPLDERTETAARHLGLATPGAGRLDVQVLARLAAGSGLDLRDLEGGLVRLALAHHQRMDACPGGEACTLLASSRRPRAST